MRDALAHPAWHEPTSVFARALASRLDLRPLEHPWPGFAADAALAVAPAALKSSGTPTTPVVVLNHRSAATTPACAASVVCGVQDQEDPVCAAIAGALAEALGLRLILVHAAPHDARDSYAFAALSGMTVPVLARDLADHGAGRELVEQVATAAGLGASGLAEIRVTRGPPGPTILTTARRERAALVVVSASTRGRLRRALQGSATRYLVRRCERPVVVCPRHPAAAMRLREALTPTPHRRRTHPWAR